MPRNPNAPQYSAPWSTALIGTLTGLVLATVVFAPASWLASALQRVSNGQLRLQDARGSVWQGSARLVLSGGEGSSGEVALPGTVSWRIRPVWGGASARISADCCTREPLSLRATWDSPGAMSVALDNSLSVWPAGLLAGLGTPWNTVQPQGQMALSSTGWGATWTQGRVVLAGQLQIDATQVASRLTTIAPMGSYRVTLAGGATPILTVATLEGSLQLSGRGQWVGQRLRFEGEASASPDRVEALSNLLNILGRRDGVRSVIKLG